MSKLSFDKVSESESSIIGQMFVFQLWLEQLTSETSTDVFGKVRS